MTALRVRPASASDVPQVIALLSEASAWLAAIGSDQWQYSPRADRITASVKAGTVWMADRDGLTVGTITLDDYADPEFWLPQDDPEDALYVHRAVVSRAVAGQHIGAALLNWASVRTAAVGRTWVRLDAWATNIQLHNYYVTRGWTHVRTFKLPHRGSGALFQRRAGTITAEAPEIIEAGVPLQTQAPGRSGPA